MDKQTTQTLTLINLDSSKTIRSAYSPRVRIQTTCSGDSLTQQSFRDECDVNRIMARYRSTGELPNLNSLEPQYLDVSEIDYKQHMDFIAGAQTMFQQLPSSIRNRFNNDPGAFLDFCSHEKNRPELAEMGLLRPIAEPSIPTPNLAPSTPQNGSNQADVKPA